MPATKLYVTFGLRYAREEHPACPWAHPDGWLTVNAPTYLEAMVALRNLTTPPGQDIPLYAFDYDEVPPAMYPRGELARLDVHADSTTTLTVKADIQ